ncbi:MAG: radical SAM protein [Candidatus Accumulibacter phosphatis]|jgi:radical SAM protein with 4Fe4S-binding SPASM domain|uniref:radical SAM/SPASM domain-containing protein n=1 Tax=Candidatus Accumulibacter TaxID=327159 RepID=UPI0025C3E8B7|nr:radical SAM protein [Candidatus Accumulibacter sp. ACC012]
MIRHVIRQERSGGLWLIRDQGRVLSVGPASYRYLEALSAGDGYLLAESLRAVAQEEDSELLPLIEEHGLHQRAAWDATRWVASKIAADQLPEDATAAPKRIYFEMTRQCNLACRSCFNASRLALANELGREGALEVNRQAWELGVFEMRYTGGECTTLPWFAEVIADAYARGFYISMGSNGVWSEETLEWLPGSGIHWVIVSLDGDRETNDRVRGRGSYDSVLRGLRMLAGHSLRTRLNMVVARHNLSALEAVARVAAEHGVDSLNLIPLRPYGRSLREMVHEMFNQEDFYTFIREVNRLRGLYPCVEFSTTIDLLDPDARTSHDLIVEKKTTCAAGVEACVVGPLGDVYGCSYSPASFPDSPDQEGWQVFVAGNLRQESLGDIWRDSRRWAVFRDLERYKHQKCLSCGHYQVRCSGSCPIMAWHELAHAEGSARHGEDIARICDPYCFADLLTAKGTVARR